MARSVSSGSPRAVIVMAPVEMSTLQPATLSTRASASMTSK